MRLLQCFFLLLFLTCYPLTLQAKALIADISDHLIKIDTRFKGTDVLLFGARNDAGDIVVVVRGPAHNYIVRKKERIAGIWVNRDQVTFKNVESFYAIASSRPLASLQNAELIRQLQLGVDSLAFVPASQKVTVSLHEFKDALLANQLTSNLYGKYKQDLPFMGEVLFKVTLHFPENIPRGVYTTETYLINNGQLIAMQSTPIIVKKIGAAAFITSSAHKNPAWYGLTAIALALLAGWLAGMVFRKI